MGSNQSTPSAQRLTWEAHGAICATIGAAWTSVAVMAGARLWTAPVWFGAFAAWVMWRSRRA